MEFPPILLAAFLVVIGFIVAMNWGVYKLLCSGCAAAVAFFIFFGGMNWLPTLSELFSKEPWPWQKVAVISACSSLLVYVVGRILFGIVLKKMLGPESKLHWICDKLPGGFLSILPSMVGVFFLFTGVRVAGTIHELNFTASLAREGIVEMAGKVPPYPHWSKWRNEIESLPFVGGALDLADPFSNRANRNVAALVLMGRAGSLRSIVVSDPAIANVAADQRLNMLFEESKIQEAVRSHDRIALVLNKKIKRFAADSDLTTHLRNFDLQRSLEDFVDSLELLDQ